MIKDSVRRGSAWSMVVWSGAVLLWLAPMVAMRFTREVNWTGFDFAVFGAMLLCAAGAFEATVRLSGNGAYRMAMGVAILAAFLLVWAVLAVGFIANEGNPGDLMFAGVLGVWLGGGAVAGFRARGMAWVMVLVAVVQSLAGIFGVIGLGAETVILGPTAFFAGLWLVSAWLFGRAARTPAARGAA